MAIYNEDLQFEIPEKNLWIFGYGSLMWNPEFDYLESQPARIYGYHRRLCLRSIKFRGTEKIPGLVLGLDNGGSCNGMGFRLADQNRNPKIKHIYDREMVSNAYRPIIKPIYLRNGDCVQALTFASKIHHPQYAPKMDIAQIVTIVKRAIGPRGTNIDYIINTVAHLESIGVHDSELQSVARELLKS